MDFEWEENFEIEIKVENKQVILWANKDGLVSLANHFLKLSKDEIPSGYHIHLDEHNSLNEGSNELIIMKMK